MNQDNVFLCLRYGIGAFFLLSGVGKIMESSLAEHVIMLVTEDFRPFMPISPRTLALGVSVIEIVIGGLMIANKCIIQAVMASCVVLLVFMLPLGELIFKGLNVAECGCSGVFDFGMSVQVALVRNIVLYCFLTWMALYLQRQGIGSQCFFAKKAKV